MNKIRLGRTGLMVSRSGFGAIPIQRLDSNDAGRLLRKAYEGGINFFDTARGYTDSEEKIGLALADVRGDILLATKNKGTDRDNVLELLETSLKNLKTDYVDLLQLHNLKTALDLDDPDSAYQGLLAAREKGMARFMTEEWKRDMAKIRDCQECGHCREQCPYELDTPTLLKTMLADYEQFMDQQPKG